MNENEWRPCFLSISSLLCTGAEDPSHTQKNRPVLRNSRLCQTHPTERRRRSLLQRLCTQPAQYRPLRRHRPGRVRGQEHVTPHCCRTASPQCFPSSHSLYSTDSEVCLAEQEQRVSRPGGHGAGRLRCRFQHLWTAGELPAGTHPHSNAGTRSG